MLELETTLSLDDVDRAIAVLEVKTAIEEYTVKAAGKGAT